MTNQTTQIMAMPEKILAALNALSPERQQQVFDFVEFLIQKQAEGTHLTQKVEKPQQKRVLGQHKGMGWISDDFNDPLPDAFWFGREDAGNPSA